VPGRGGNCGGRRSLRWAAVSVEARMIAPSGGVAPGAVPLRADRRLGELNEVSLRGKAVAVWNGAGPCVAAGGLEQAGLASVGK